WATTTERGNSGGSITCYLTEVALMATILTPSYPVFFVSMPSCTCYLRNGFMTFAAIE
ncbi:ash family protein, partial [Salmonella enterica]|uniref:ash family protein n=1 Tax=Salmonella enterica TaxID=28901 RepID=UPI003F584FF4